MWKRLFLGIFILLAFEVGLLLIVFPWTLVWDKNFFLTGFAPLRTISMSPFVKGAVSGLGLLNVFVAISETWHFRERVRDMDAKEQEELTADERR
jgi:hypothetical protein